MQKLDTAAIRKAARDILAEDPGGVRWAELVKAVRANGPGTPTNTIEATLVGWASRSEEVAKPSRGLWVLKAGLEDVESLSPDQTGADKGSGEKLSEDSLYLPFAEWPMAEDEATVAKPFGGSSHKHKWGTPDVIGVSKPKASDPIRFPVEIVAAELKTDGNASIVAFGQACAYRLFAHRSYIVTPETLPALDRDRLLSLCGLYGIGLVLWADDTGGPSFRFEARARSQQPDTYYANEFAKRIRELDQNAFDALF